MCVDQASCSVQAAQQSALQLQIGVAVARKSLDATQLQGDAVNQLLADAAALSKAIGKGENFDAVG